VLLGSSVVAVLAGLSLPVSALAGAPSTVPRGVTAGAAPGQTVYVVRPGDTLWSIAWKFDRGGDLRPMAEAIARETGSDTVLPGEHILIP
jgi:LysM repeat protein